MFALCILDNFMTPLTGKVDDSSFCFLSRLPFFMSKIAGQFKKCFHLKGFLNAIIFGMDRDTRARLTWMQIKVNK